MLSILPNKFHYLQESNCKTMFKNYKFILGMLLGILIVVGLLYGPKYLRAMEIAKKSEMEYIEDTFINMDKYFEKTEVAKSSAPFMYPRTANVSLPDSFEANGKEYQTMDYLDSSYTQGFLVIQNDTIVYENYWRGMDENTRHISWSMAKSVVSALLGIAKEEGHIGSLDKTVDEYMPEFKGTGYEGVKVKDVLQMSSGVKFNEDYGDPKSDIQRWFKTFALGESQDEFATTLVNEKEPGTYNHYVSINTHVLGMLLVKSTGQSINSYFKEKLWDPIGAEHDAYWLVDEKGMEMALGGLNATLRDYAKVGSLFLHDGNWHGEQLVPASWVEESQTMDAEHLQPDSKNSLHPDVGYGYQWWIPDGDDEELWARGVFNQYIYINPKTNTVIVKLSANQHFYNITHPATDAAVNLELLRKVAYAFGGDDEEAVVGEGLLSLESDD